MFHKPASSLTPCSNLLGQMAKKRFKVKLTDYSSDGRFLVIAGGRVCHVGAEEDDRFAEDLGSDAGNEDGVDAAEFDVDLEAEIGQRLWRRFVDVFGLKSS
jgi:hypothetical protein